jgi:hypothetical protein
LSDDPVVQFGARTLGAVDGGAATARRHWYEGILAHEPTVRGTLVLDDDGEGQPSRFELEERTLGPDSGVPVKTVTSRGQVSMHEAPNPARVLPGEPPTLRIARFVAENDPSLNRQFVSNPRTFQLLVMSDAGDPVGGDSMRELNLMGSADATSVTVTDLASGWPVQLSVGQALIARLEVTRNDVPRVWTLRAASDGGLLSMAGSEREEDGGVLDAGSPVQIIRLKAVKAGATTLAFDYTYDGKASEIWNMVLPVVVR